MLSWSVCSLTVIVHIVSNRQTRPTQQQQLHLSGRLLSVFSEVLVYHFGSLRGSLVLGAHRAAHGSARTTSLPQTSRKKGRASVQMPSGCASNGGGVPVSTEAQTQPWAEFWPTWLKSHRCSSVRLQRSPTIIWILIGGYYVHVDTPGDVCAASIRALKRLFVRCWPGDRRVATAAVVVGDAPRNFLTVLPWQF